MPVHFIGNDAAAYRFVGVMRPQNAPGFSVEGAHIAVEIARERQSTRRRRDRAHHRRRGAILPRDFTRIGVQGGDVAAPLAFRVGFAELKGFMGCSLSCS